MLIDRKPVRRIFWLVPAMMFACGASFALSEALRIGIPRGDVFRTCLITMLALGIMFYNRRTALVTAGLAAAAGIYAFLRRDALYGALYPVAEEAVRYIVSSDGSAEIRLLVGRLLAAGISVFAVFTAGRMRGGWLLCMASIAVFVSAWALGMREVFGCLALCASASAAASAGTFAGKVAASAEPREKKRGAGGRKRKSAGKSRPEEDGDTRRSVMIGSPRAAALFAIPVAVLTAIAGTLVRPAELSESFKIVRVEEAVGDMVDSLASSLDGYTRRSVMFSLNAVGYGPAAELGGPADPVERTTLLVGTSDPLQNLRGSVRARYTGKGWEEGELEGAYRFASNLWRDEKTDAFDLLRGNVPGRQDRFGRAYRSMSYTVYHYSHYTSMFTLERPERVTASGLVPYFNLQGEMYPKEELREGDSYEIRGYGQTALTKTSASALSALVGYGDREDEETLRTIYAEYLPDGPVELHTGSGTSAGEEQGMSALDEAEAQSAYGSVTYHLFYGYTEAQARQLAENQARITRTADRLFDEDEPQSEEELLEMLAKLEKFEETLPKVEPTAVWLTDDELAALGVSVNELRAALGTMGMENIYRQDSATRDFLRATMYVTSAEALGDISDFRYVGPDIPPEEERSSAAVYMKTDAWRWWTQGTGGMAPNKVQYIRYRPFPLEGRGGTYYGGYLPGTSASLADLMEALGYVRLEYGGMQRYMPNIARNFGEIVLERFDGGTDGEPNRFDLALELARALDESTEYTLSPTEVPEGVDFVNWFLSTREGYCTYYATAMAVLARGYGIPSRYAEGYNLTGAERNENGLYELTGKDAHAWPELFFEGVGWVTVDPLALDLLERDYAPEPAPPAEVVQPSAPPTEAPSEPDEEKDDVRPGDAERAIPAAVLAAAAAVGCVLLLLALFLAARALALRGRSLPALRRKYGDRGAVKELWLEAARLLGLIEPLCRRVPGETAGEFAERVKRIIYVDGASPEDAAHTAEKAWYSPEELTEPEMEASARYVSALRRMMFRKRFWGLSWVKRRYLDK